MDALAAARKAGRREAIGSEGYLRLQPEPPNNKVLLAIASAHTKEGPWMRDQRWEDGKDCEIYPYGSGVPGARGYIEIPVAVWNEREKRWEAKMLDEPLSRVNPLLDASDGKDGWSFWLERSNIYRNKRVVGVLTAEPYKEYGDSIDWGSMTWPKPKGSEPGKEGQQRPVEAVQRGIAGASTGDMPF